MRALSPKILRELLRMFEADDAPLPRDQYIIHALQQALKPKRAVRASRKVREKKRATRREKVAELRAKVFARAREDGRPPFCEAGYCANAAAEMDHFFGGSNRRSLERLEGCWALCVRCHAEKTRCIGGRARWLSAFLAHSRCHGYHAEPQRKAQAELESLQMQGRAKP